MLKKLFFYFLFLNLMTSISSLCATDLEQKNPKEMNISPQGTKLISYFEGFSATSYTCLGNKTTIGFGHVVKEWEKNEFLRGITREKGEELLKTDLEKSFVLDVQKLVKMPLKQGEFDALTSFIYNLGAKNLETSTLLKHLNNNLRNEASLEFGVWRNCSGKYVPGLLKRRIVEMLIFRGNNEIPDDLKTIQTKDGTLMHLYSQLDEKLKKEIQSIFTSYQNTWRN